MSHEVETMMYVREEPWHGLGTRLPEEVKAAEAMAVAGLDWKVEMRPLYYDVKAGTPGVAKVPGELAVVRMSDDKVLGIQGPGYTPFQNEEAFSFFDEVVGSGQAVYHTAGSLRGGKRIWILAKLPQTAQVKGVDPVQNYLLLCNGHDGKMALRMHWTPIRVVCWNTLQMAMGRQVGQAFYARHTGGIEERVSVAQDMLGFAQKRFEGFMENANRIARASFLKGELDDFLRQVLEYKEDKKDEEQAKGKVLAMARIKELVETGAGLQEKKIRGTKWAVYNAITEWVDHERPTRSARGRLDIAWFGDGADLKDRAWALLNKN